MSIPFIIYFYKNKKRLIISPKRYIIKLNDKMDFYANMKEIRNES